MHSFWKRSKTPFADCWNSKGSFLMWKPLWQICSVKMSRKSTQSCCISLQNNMQRISLLYWVKWLTVYSNTRSLPSNSCLILLRRARCSFSSCICCPLYFSEKHARFACISQHHLLSVNCHTALDINVNLIQIIQIQTCQESFKTSAVCCPWTLDKERSSFQRQF